MPLVYLISLLLIAGVSPWAYAAASPPSHPASPRIAFLGIWDRSGPLVSQAMQQTSIPAITLEETDIADTAADKADVLANVDVLLALNLHPQYIPTLKKRLAEAKARNPKLKIIPLDHRGSQAALDAANLLHHDKRVPAYWIPNGAINMARLLTYIDATYLGGQEKIQPPVAVPQFGFYIPGQPDRPITTVADLRRTPTWKPNAPVAALLIQQSFWITRDLKVVDAEAAALQKRGINVAVTFAETAGQMEALLRQLRPDILLEDRHGSMWSDPVQGKTLLDELEVPYLRPISMLAYTRQQWLADPKGMAPRDVGKFMTLQESRGTVEPLVVGALAISAQGYQLHEPIPGRADRFADRVSGWLNLRSKPNADKRIAIIYYNNDAGKGDLMQGTPTGGFLDAPESLMRFLPRLKAAGYTVTDIPENAAALMAEVRDHGQNLGPWAQGDLDKLADNPSTVLISLATYQHWFNTKLSAADRKAVVKHFGPPPGKLMVVQRNDQPYIVIPTIRMGHIILAPQPLRGEVLDTKLLHSRTVPPPHNYLAFYWWLNEQFKADAVMHWGTHGTLELLPGKTNGLTGEDWGDILVGDMPVINLWIMSNLGEATLSRRRSYALLVDHLAPLAVRSKIDSAAQKLHNNIEKFNSLGTGLLRKTFRERITEEAKAQRYDQTLKLHLKPKTLLSDAQITAVHDYIHTLIETANPTTLHVLGQPPDTKSPGFPGFLVSVLHKPFLDRVAALSPPEAEAPSEEGRTGRVPQLDPSLRGQAVHVRPGRSARLGLTDSTQAVAPNPTVPSPSSAGLSQSEGSPEQREAVEQRAERIIRNCVLGDQPPPPSLAEDVKFARGVVKRLNDTGQEITNLLRALDGKYIAPGPGPDPIRNPASVPSGRNLYTLNPEEIPTHESWDVAVKLVKQMLAKRPIHKIAIDLSGSSTMADYGVREAQILYLMGVKPVWDRNNLAIDVKLIPMSQLKRPRVDVFVAVGGSYKANFGSRIKLIDKAIRLASSAKEADNGVRQGSLALQAALLKEGFSPKRAKQLATARIFGTSAGNLSGTNILYLVPRSGAWQNDGDITSVYIDHMSYVYSGQFWGVKIPGLYKQAIQGTDTIERVWSSHLTSPLANHHAYEYLGGLSMAVKQLTGKEPTALIADVRDPDGARIREFGEVLDTNLRKQLLNRTWIAGMKSHDYAGAGQMAELVRNLFGWSVTRHSAVTDGMWNDVYATYIQDKLHLGLTAWFDKVNPHAKQAIEATMLEAARKGYWHASAKQLATLSRAYAASVAKYGASDGLMAGGNTALQNYVAAHLNAPGEQALAKAFHAAMAKAATPARPATGLEKVVGRQLKSDRPAAPPDAKQAPGQPSRQATTPDTVTLPENRPWWPWALGGALLVLFILGAWRKTGGIA